MGRIDVAAERAIVDQAARCLGLVTRSELFAADVSASAVDDRVRRGRLRVLHPGIYLTGHNAPSRDQRLLAAVLAGGPAAVLGMASASELWALLSAAPGPPQVLSTGPRRDGPRGIHLRCTTYLPETERTVHRGIPVTTPARTLLDLASAGHPGLELATNEALARRLVSRHGLEALAASGRPGCLPLRRVMTDLPGYTRPGAERALRSLVARVRLPRPEYNARVPRSRARRLLRRPAARRGGRWVRRPRPPSRL